MATETTTSKKFKFITEYYATGLDIHVTNDLVSEGEAEVEFREVFDDKEKLDPGDCTNHYVAPYTEVWFRSVSGKSVTVTTGWGTCAKPIDERGGIDDQMKVKIKAKIEKARDSRLKLERKVSKLEDKVARLTV